MSYIDEAYQRAYEQRRELRAGDSRYRNHEAVGELIATGAIKSERQTIGAVDGAVRGAVRGAVGGAVYGAIVQLFGSKEELGQFIEALHSHVLVENIATTVGETAKIVPPDQE